jgi:carboxylesterase type B
MLTTSQVMTQHTSNESVPFTPPTIATAADVRAYAVLSFPEASSATIDTLLNVIYPDVLDGTYPYTTEFARASRIATEMQFACTARYLSVALNNKTYNSIFAYPPGYHGEDVPYVFFNGDITTTDDGLPVNPIIASDLQKYITTFSTREKPNYAGGLTWPVYGDDANVLEFTYSGPVAGIDDLKNSRCDWIQQAIANGLF